MSDEAIDEAILEFDGKYVAPLKAVSSKTFETDTIDQIIGFCEAAELNCRIAATWLLKAHLEKGGTLSKAQTNKLIKLLPTFTEWEVALHLLQSLRYMETQPKHIKALSAFLDAGAASDKIFVQVWTMDAAVYLADQHPVFEARAAQALADGLEGEKASMRARARNLLKARNLPKEDAKK